MTDNYEEARRRYQADFNETVERHINRAFDYEQKAIEFANNTLRALTYLNGGALIALPTALALFHTDTSKAKVTVIIAGLCFVLGLVCVVLSQAAAFFTMARRSELQSYLEYGQTLDLQMLHFPQNQEKHAATLADAQSNRAMAEVKRQYSNWWRQLALIAVWSSLLAFIIGSGFGAYAILGIS